MRPGNWRFAAIVLVLTACEPALDEGAITSLDNIERQLTALQHENKVLRERLDEAERRVDELSTTKANQDALTASDEAIAASVAELVADAAATRELVEELGERLEELGEASEQMQNSLVQIESTVGSQAPVVEDAAAFLSVARVDEAGDVVIEGANLYVQSGVSDPEKTNGKGNVIIGYDRPFGFCSNQETKGCDEDSDCGDGLCEPTTEKTGSHNLVIGLGHTYTSVNSVLVGERNSVTAPGCLVAGHLNTATGRSAAITGGRENTAAGNYSAVHGGYDNVASYWHSVVVGGHNNQADGNGSVVTGGYDNTATGSNVVPSTCSCPEQ